ncbi:MAG: cyclase family protein, partial [Anaerolineaceae bacterium]|nr:cyclase family protein [Anaerolineaceae bacterium]
GEVPLGKLVGEALVMEIGEGVDVITRSVLEAHAQLDALKKAHKVLFKTRNSSQLSSWANHFHENYVALDTSGAEFLSEMSLDLVGVDYLSIAAYHDIHVPHQLLLQKEIVLLEGINLAEVPAGIFDLYCLPLNLVECEGAPARAILSSV